MNWNDRDNIIELIKSCSSKSEVLRKMNKSTKSSRNRRLLDDIMQELGIVYGNYNSRKPEYCDILPSAVPNCSCWSDVVRAVGLLPRGDNIKTVKIWVKLLNLDTSHFDSKKAMSRGSPVINLDEICVKDSTTSNWVLKRKILAANAIEYKCQSCGLSDNWNGKPLTLQLDHINGVPNDHRLINLRFLCPNCHTQTLTWGRKIDRWTKRL